MGARDEAKVFKELEREGLLLFTDPKLKSVAGIVAGEPIHGSWWSHEKGRLIFAVCEKLSDHPDILIAPLVSGKLTWIHKPLWPAVIAVATQRAPWQMTGLPPLAKSVLAKVSRADSVRSDTLTKPEATASKILETRLLVHGGQVHTEKGAHARVLESWENWALAAGFHGKLPDPARAMALLAAKVAALNALYRTSARLPWGAVSSRGR